VTITSFSALVARRSRCGVAIPGVVGPWTQESAVLAGVLPAAALTPAPVGFPGATGSTSAATPRLRVLVVAPKTGKTGTTGVTPSGQPINNKQHVHMTRVNAGGDGASGPHPERAPA